MVILTESYVLHCYIPAVFSSFLKLFSTMELISQTKQQLTDRYSSMFVMAKIILTQILNFFYWLLNKANLENNKIWNTGNKTIKARRKIIAKLKRLFYHFTNKSINNIIPLVSDKNQSRDQEVHNLLKFFCCFLNLINYRTAKMRLVLSWPRSSIWSPTKWTGTMCSWKVTKLTQIHPAKESKRVILLWL